MAPSLYFTHPAPAERRFHRTLQRQPADTGTDFSNLLGDVRQELAMRYLANVRYPIGRIAALLREEQR